MVAEMRTVGLREKEAVSLTARQRPTEAAYEAAGFFVVGRRVLWAAGGRGRIVGGVRCGRGEGASAGG